MTKTIQTTIQKPYKKYDKNHTKTIQKPYKIHTTKTIQKPYKTIQKP